MAETMIKARKFNYQLAPLLITFVLGPMLENALRQGLILSDGSLEIFFNILMSQFQNAGKPAIGNYM